MLNKIHTRYIRVDIEKVSFINNFFHSKLEEEKSFWYLALIK